MIGLIGLLNFPLAIVFSGQANSESPIRVEFVLGGLAVLEIPLVVYLLKGLFQTTLARAAIVWGMGLVAGILSLAAVGFVVKPLLIEAFAIPTNSMAPTLIGWHREAKCPLCGGTAILTAPAPDDHQFRALRRDDSIGICTACGQMSTIQDAPATIHRGDRFIANKTLSPRRWDIIVFRYPQNPETKYVKRVVGLPGEEVYIKEGAIWVNGMKTDLPKDVGNWAYTTGLDDAQQFDRGTPESPWRLADDEVAVLGDFAWRSSDSRVWGPVPLANIEGVAGIRYWPPTRFQVWK
jgi:signal peptidase I